MKLELDEFEAYELLETAYAKEFQLIKIRLNKRLTQIKIKLAKIYPNLDVSNITLSFEDCFIDENQQGMIYARCHDLDNYIIEINCYPIANMLNKEFSIRRSLKFLQNA